MSVKYVVKKIYMWIVHPLIMLTAKEIGTGCFIGKRARINKCKYITIEKNVRIGQEARFSFYDEFEGKKYTPKLYIEEGAYLGDYLTILCADVVKIEKDVLMASHILITTENHGMDPENSIRYGNQKLVTAPVYIGTGAWVGEKVMILPGVSIGEKAIIAAGAVVTHDIPAFSIAAGNPARVIKKYNFELHRWEKCKNNEEK